MEHSQNHNLSLKDFENLNVLNDEGIVFHVREDIPTKCAKEIAVSDSLSVFLQN